MIFNWKKKNWLNLDKKPVKNKEMWIDLDILHSKHNIIGIGPKVINTTMKLMNLKEKKF